MCLGCSLPYDRGMAITYCRPVNNRQRNDDARRSATGKEEVPNYELHHFPCQHLAVCDGSTCLISRGIISVRDLRFNDIESCTITSDRTPPPEVWTPQRRRDGGYTKCDRDPEKISPL